MDALELGFGIIRRSTAIHGENWNWAGHSEQAQYYALQVSIGDVSRDTYVNAEEAFKDAQIADNDPSKAPAGSVSYFAVGEGVYVVTNLGNGLCISTSPLMEGKELFDFGQNLRVSRLTDYTQGVYLGWSLRDGKRPRIIVDEASEETFV
jgi:hypothetical protein